MAQPYTVLIQEESTEGDDEFGGVISAAGAFAIDVGDLQLTPYEGNKYTSQSERFGAGNKREYNTAPRASISFTIEATGMGAAATPPGYAAALKACGFDLTGTNFTVASDNASSASIYLIDQETHEVQLIAGARGNVSFSMSKGEMPKFNFSFQGSYQTPGHMDGDLALPPIVWSTLVPNLPSAMSKENTQVLTFNNKELRAESVSIDWGNQIDLIDVPYYSAVNIDERKGTLNLTILTEEFGTAQYQNWIQLAESHTVTNNATIPFAMEHGPAAGNSDRLVFDCSECQITNIQKGESGQRRNITLTANIMDFMTLSFT